MSAMVILPSRRFKAGFNPLPDLPLFPVAPRRPGRRPSAPRRCAWPEIGRSLLAGTAVTSQPIEGASEAIQEERNSPFVPNSNTPWAFASNPPCFSLSILETERKGKRGSKAHPFERGLRITVHEVRNPCQLEDRVSPIRIARCLLFRQGKDLGIPASAPDESSGVRSTRQKSGDRFVLSGNLGFPL